MTNHRSLHRAWSSLRGPKTPNLLCTSGASRTGPYDHLEEPEPAWGAGGEEGAEQRVSPGKGDPRGGRGRRRGGSLRVRRKASQGEAAEAASDGGPGEVATLATVHLPGPVDDGQLLLGETDGQVGGRMKKCKKQVSRALQRGWETFTANVYSLTLSRPTRTASAASSV